MPVGMPLLAGRFAASEIQAKTRRTRDVPDGREGRKNPGEADTIVRRNDKFAPDLVRVAMPRGWSTPWKKAGRAARFELPRHGGGNSAAGVV
jgi:hypothetical protein